MNYVCPMCKSRRFTDEENGFVKCKACGTKVAVESITGVENEEKRTISVLEKVSKGVCRIETAAVGVDEDLSKPVCAAATGWYIGNHMIVTNSHVALADHFVLNSIPCLKIVCHFEYLNPALHYETKVWKVDQINDLAILHIEDDSNLIPYAIKLASDDNLSIGQTVYTIGNTIGRGLVPNKGIISDISYEDTYFDFKKKEIDTFPIIRTALTIRHGNSGGPLINSRGEAIGAMSAGFCNVATIDIASNLGMISGQYQEECPELSIARKVSLIKKLIDQKETYNGKNVPAIVKEEFYNVVSIFQTDVLPNIAVNDSDSMLKILNENHGLLSLFNEMLKQVDSLKEGTSDDLWYVAPLIKDLDAYLIKPKLYNSEDDVAYSYCLLSANIYINVLLNKSVILYAKNAKEEIGKVQKLEDIQGNFVTIFQNLMK